MDTSRWRLSDPFWSEFVTTTWEKQPAVLTRPFPHPLVTEAEGLAWLRRAFCEPRDAAGKEFFVGFRKQASPTGALLPEPGEESVAGFASRLGRERSLRNFQYVVYALQRFDPQPWFRTRTFFGPLLARVGLPAGDVNTDCFFGDYRETAAGLHKDNASVFSYVVHGSKKMLVWPFEYFEKETANPAALYEKDGLPHVDIRRHMDAATVLEGRAGDILYWPSTYWHIGVGDGQPHMTFNMSLYFPYRARKRVEEVLDLLLEPEFRNDWMSFHPFETDRIQELAQSVPDAWARVVETYRRVLASPKFEGMLLAAWMRRLTSGGFTSLPAWNSDTRVDPEDSFTGRPGSPVLSAPLGGGKLLMAANGGVFLADEAGPVRSVIEAVNSGEPFTLASIVRRTDGPDSNLEVEIRALIEKLLRFWAVERHSHSVAPE